ncbi:MAG: RNA polymerase factor sigma-54 [Burkholderiaceae bacterium]
MKPGLSLRTSQHLSLTPQLQQSIRLLQLSTLELSQEIEQALAQNPMLERADDPMDSAMRLQPNGGLQSPGSTASDGAERDSQTSGDPREAPADAGNEGHGADPGEGYADSPEQGGDYSGDWQGGSSRQRSEGSDDESDYQQLASAQISLREHLMSQLASTGVTERDRALVHLLIDELSDDGYLQTPLDEIAQVLPAELDIDPQELSAALRLLQSFDPLGVGAIDLRESLLLQIDRPDGEAGTPDNVRRTARLIVRDHLDLLATKDFNRLRRSLRCSDETLRAAHQLIIGLDPRPGARFTAAVDNYVIPDVIVRRAGQGWQVTLNPAVMPKLQVNDFYADVLRRNRGISGSLSGQLQEARWLIKNVQQRFDTILRVSEAIVDRQKAYFAHGAVGMRPLVLREIADILELHESTVSRVTTQKYMLTPHGIVELKYFFGSHIATDSGGAASSTAIRALIKQLIDAEDTTHPISDSQIASLLGEKGFVVARRTVAKYRESLRIPPVAQRKTL